MVTGFVMYLVASLAVGYITFVLCYSKIAKPIRDYLYESRTGFLFGYFNGMLECPFCTGFWVSVAVQIVLGIPVLGSHVLALMLVVPALAMLGAVIAKTAGWMIGATDF
jgi:hypothetical protein